ncbi:MAG: tetratricopeptide repeat protein, partial [Muribaculaceae bacterium]|nr:tetratricopeptide repeat protein [Muribaculaceae bacterium]
SQTAQSDSLFSIGVELYNKGKYKEAIPVFEQVWQIDSVTLPETSTRRTYGEEWLAASLYKKGDKERAKKTSKLSYNLEPVDRRLTVEADSLLEEAYTEFRNGMPFLAELKINRSLEALKSTFGVNHPAYLAGLYNLMDFYLVTQDVQKALRCAEEMEELIKVLKPEATFFMGAVNTVKALDAFLNQMNRDNRNKTYPPEHYATAYAAATELGEKAREQLKGYMEYNGYLHSVLMDLLGGVYLRMNREDIYSSILSEGIAEWDTLSKERKVNVTTALEQIIMGMLQLSDIDLDKAGVLIDEDLSLIDYYSSLHPDQPYPYENKARMLKQRAFVNFYKNDPEGTAKYAKETFDILNENSDINAEDYADLMTIYGNALSSLNRNAESEDWIDRAISVLERKGDDGAYHLIGAYMTKTDLISANGDKRAALEYAKSKFSKIEKYSSTFSDVAAMSLKICGLSSFFSDKADIEESKKWLNKTIGIFRSLGDDGLANPDYFKTHWASSLFNPDPSALSGVYEELEEIIRRNPSNPFIGMMKGWLADIHANEQIRAGNAEEALNYNSQAIAFFSDSTFPVPSELYETQQRIYGILGDKENSLASAKKRVETLEKVTGERSLEYIRALHELANNYGMNLQLEEALNIFDKEKKILMDSWDKFPKPEVSSHLLDIVEGYNVFSKYEEADKLLDDILAKNPDLKKNKELYLWWKIDKTRILTSLNRFEEALKMAQDLENDVARNKYNSNYSMLGLVRAANTYYSAGDFPKAKDTFDKAYPYFKSQETAESIMGVLHEMGIYCQLLEMCGEKEKSEEISSFYTAKLGDSVAFDDSFSELFKFSEMAYNAYMDKGLPGMAEFYEGKLNDYAKKYGASAQLTEYLFQNYLQSLLAVGEATDAY